MTKVAQKWMGVRKIEKRQITPIKTRTVLDVPKSHVPKEIYENSWKGFIGKLYW